MNWIKILGACFAISIWTCFLPETSFAKDKPWEQKLTQALDESDTNAKLEQLNALLSKSTDPDQTIILNYYIGQTYTNMSHFGSAIAPLSKALSLNDTHTPDHHKRRDAISTLLQTAFLKAGRTREGLAIANETVARNDALVADMWSRDDTSIVHRFSALKCPHHIGAITRTEAHSFDTYARDIGCSYKEYRDEENLLTIYFTKYEDDTLTPKSAHASATSMMTRAGSSKNAKLIYDAKTVDFNNSTTPHVLATLFLRHEGRQYTGTWTAVIEDWTLKTRATWDVNLGENWGEEASRKIFTQATQQTSTQIKACKAANWPKEGEITTRAGIEFVMLEALTTSSERPSLECILGFSDKGNAFIAGYLDGPRLYTIAGTAIGEDVFVESSLGVNRLSDLKLSPEYILKSRREATSDHKASTTIYKAYKTKPSPDQVFQDFIDIYSGKASSYGRVEFSENGDTHIILNTTEENPITSSEADKD